MPLVAVALYRASKMAAPARDDWKLCAEWLVTCKILPPDHKAVYGGAEALDLVQSLRDGVLLCHLLNILKPGCIDLKDFSQRPQMSQVPNCFLFEHSISWWSPAALPSPLGWSPQRDLAHWMAGTTPADSGPDGGCGTGLSPVCLPHLGRLHSLFVSLSCGHGGCIWAGPVLSSFTICYHTPGSLWTYTMNQCSAVNI